MCILYIYCAKECAEDAYKLILVFNRDEYYARPTRPADFLENYPDVLAGMDMEPGREGGTWLAISKIGKIAALLNVLQSKEALVNAGTRKGRGFLVKNFVTSKNSNSKDYLAQLETESSDYNLFSMVAVDIPRNQNPRAYYFSNKTEEKVRPLDNGTVYGIGNSFIDTPFEKVKAGREEIIKIINDLNCTSKRDHLVSAIMEVMTNLKNYHPDQQMVKQAPDLPAEFLLGLSSRLVRLPNYGTRTHTVILVDNDNKAFFYEKTLVPPINAGNFKWKESTYEFTICE